MTPSERLLLAAIKPLMPQIEKQLQPALEMFIEGRLKEIEQRKTVAGIRPAMLILQDTNGTIYLCDTMMRDREVVGIQQRMSLDYLTKQIVSNLTDI